MKRMKPNTEERLTRHGETWYQDTRTGAFRRRWWTKARIPGTVRASRLPGGSGFRNNWEADAETAS